MPIYEYECEKCEYRFERFQNFQDEEVKTCEKCGGPVRRLISRTAFVLKGSGWYLTDYPSKSRKEGMKAENTRRVACNENTYYTTQTLKFTKDDFQSKAEELRNIAYCHGMQL